MSAKDEQLLAKLQNKQAIKQQKYKDIHVKDENYKHILDTLQDVFDDLRIEMAGSLGNATKRDKKRNLISRLTSAKDILDADYASLKNSKNYSKAEKFYKRKAKERNKTIKEHNKLVKEEMAKQLKEKRKEEEKEKENSKN